MQMLKNIPPLRLALLAVFLCMAVFLAGLTALRALYDSTLASSAQKTSADAIAIRVIKNPDNHSALRWYQEQGFTGSPQSTTVDGYEAVRDGRTVYVNAANIAAGTLHTNIYLISYNQAAEQKTLDIFGRILAHWKFNTNITTSGVCNQSNTLVCLYDIDCPTNEYCQSQKAQIIRDTERLAALAEIKLALEKFQEQRGHYPKLAAGSYLPNKTLSTWPSWQNILAQELKLKLPLDPINRLGDCAANYNPITCWDEVSKSFSDADLTDPEINLPDNSYAMVYSAEANGSTYSLCAVMESGYVSGTTAGVCAGSNVIISFGNVANRAPLFINKNFPIGYSGEEYNAYLQAIDPDGDPLLWSIDTAPAGQWNFWSAAPVMNDLPMLDQKQVFAAQAGLSGAYSVVITIDDGRGEPNSQVSVVSTINIENLPPVITAESISYEASTTNPWLHVISATDSASNFPLSQSYIGSSPLTVFAGLSDTFDPDAGVYTLSGILSAAPSNVFSDASNVNKYDFIIAVTDFYGATGQAPYSISVINHAPQFAIPNTAVTVGLPITPMEIVATDQENNDAVFVASGLPAGLAGAKIGTRRFVISGTPIGSHPSAIDYTVSVVATDDFSYSSNESFTLTVNNTPPVMDPVVCPATGSVGASHSCSAISASDPDGHAIASFIINGLPPGLAYDSSSGEIMGIPTVMGSYTVRVRARDEYDAVSDERQFLIDVNFSADFMTMSDWGTGTGKNLLPGQEWLEVNPISTPYLWVANSNDNTVVRVNTQTHVVHGPFPVGINPSRTSIGINGDVWVGNRGSDNITHLDINGNFIKNCPTGPGVRGVAIDAEGFVWAANYGDGTIWKLDYNNCATPLEVYNTNIDTGGGYGAAADGVGNIWVVGPNDGAAGVRHLTKINTLDKTSTVYPVGAYLYGISIDHNDFVWVAEWAEQKVLKFNQNGQVVGSFFLGMNSRAVAVDSDNNVWITHSLDDRVTKLDNNGNVLFSICSDPTMNCATTLGAHPIGITATADGFIWVVNYTTSRAVKINQNNGAVVTSVNVGAGPYTYSDMAGYMLRSVTLSGGSWLVEIDSTAPNPTWQNLSWSETQPGDSRARLRVRSAGTYVGLASAVWSPYYDTSAVNLSAVPGINSRWLQIEVDLTLSSSGLSPTVDNINVTCNN